MAKFPELPLWTDSWIADTHHLTRCERGTYLDLLILMWRTPGCQIPNDDTWLGRHLRMTPEEVAVELRPLISEFCSINSIYIFQKRLQKEFNLAAARKQKATTAAKALWRNKKDLQASNASTSTSTSTSTEEKKTDTNRVLGERVVRARAPRSRGHPLPENWSPKGIGISSVDLWELGKFRDYALAKHRLCADWEAAWRNWQKQPWYGQGFRDGAAGVTSPEDLEARRNAIREVERRKNGGDYAEELRAKIRGNT